ncbi:MAG: hypothetical protein OCC45_05880 [Desulfotalea sp.]
MLKKLFYTVTDGRPMTELEFYFNDKKTQLPVYRYKDYFGRYWMANSKWSKERIVSVNDHKEQ